MSDLTVGERLTLIEEAGWPIAWEGCHKIYFLQDDERRKQAVYYGYPIYEAQELRRIWDESCSLRFVSRWGFDNDDFDHEWNIDQFEE